MMARKNGAMEDRQDQGQHEIKTPEKSQQQKAEVKSKVKQTKGQ